MISVVVSAISIVVIITVTVVLVTSNQKAHSEQKQQLRKVINDVNSVNTTTAEVDRQQNNAILSLNSNVALARTTANNVRTFVDSSFSNLAREVRSDSGMFNTMNANTIRTNEFSINNIPFTARQDYIGFGMSACNTFNIGVGASNTGYMSMPGAEGLNIYLRNSNVAPLSIKGNSVGIGMVPKYDGTLEVGGAVWTRNGLMTVLVQTSTHWHRLLGMMQRRSH
jgi:uncharacterized protein YoxC